MTLGKPSTTISGSGISAQAAKSIAMFNDRAPNYDTATGGWHAKLGRDFVTWIQPAAGSSVLDLACGTGLVTIPMAKAVGKDGVVVGVDITPGMLEQARRKKLDGDDDDDDDSAKIEWIEHDVTNLDDVEAIQRVLQAAGGFDIVSCCSALVLLPDPAHAVKHWASLLKPGGGGRMIIDVPTEDKTLQHLFTVDLRDAVGTSLPYDRSWITDIHSLERICQEAGLVVEKSWRTRSYLPERWYAADQMDEVFDENTTKVYKSFVNDGKLEEARRHWPALWTKNLRENGKFWDGHALYVTIARKP